MTATPTRPALRYYGGKWKLAPWIASHFPMHDRYVEPFGGGGSVLLRKHRAAVEVYNDLDGRIVNVFRMLRDRGGELLEKLRATPYARAEFELATQPCDDPLEAARRAVVHSWLGFGCSGGRPTRISFRKSATPERAPARDWFTLPDHLEAIVSRLSGVLIENRDAIEILREYDSPTTLHYVDPPYLQSCRTRADYHSYQHDMTDEDHRALAATLRQLKGGVVLSGYSSPLYEQLFPDWHQETAPARGQSNNARQEVVWLNPAATPIGLLDLTA